MSDFDLSMSTERVKYLRLMYKVLLRMRVQVKAIEVSLYGSLAVVQDEERHAKLMARYKFFNSVDKRLKNWSHIMLQSGFNRTYIDKPNDISALLKKDLNVGIKKINITGAAEHLNELGRANDLFCTYVHEFKEKKYGLLIPGIGPSVDRQGRYLDEVIKACLSLLNFITKCLRDL